MCFRSPSSSAVLALTILVGCGRIAFDAGATDGAIDARLCTSPVGHDEDADGIDDACDVCPHVADSNQEDQDGDRVGDACDFGQGAQHIGMFDPFTQARAEWIYQGGTFSGDAIHFQAVGTSLGATLNSAPANDVFEIGAVVGAGGTTDRQLSLQVAQAASAAHYYCELYDAGANLVLNFTYTFNGSVYTQIDGTALPGRLESGTATLRLVHAPPIMTCLATWNGVDYAVGGMIPAGIAADVFEISVNDVDAAIAYFVRIATP